MFRMTLYYDTVKIPLRLQILFILSRRYDIAVCDFLPFNLDVCVWVEQLLAKATVEAAAIGQGQGRGPTEKF